MEKSRGWVNLFLHVQKVPSFSLRGRGACRDVLICVFLFQACSYMRCQKSHQLYKRSLWTRFSRLLTLCFLPSCAFSPVRFAMPRSSWNRTTWGRLATAQAVEMMSFRRSFSYNFVFLLGFPATGSCHHRVLCCCPRTGGSGRDVFQQLLPLHALARSTERRDGPGPVGTQWEAHPRTTWQPVRLRGARSGWAQTPALCVSAHASARAGPLPNVPPTQIRKSEGNKSSHNRVKNVKYQWEAGNSWG